MSWTILDIQGFKSSDNEFIVKELFILKETSSSSFLFKPPFDKDKLSAKAKRSNQYCTDNFHGLDWDSGEVPYCEMEEIIKSFCKDSKVVCKGSEKLHS